MSKSLFLGATVWAGAACAPAPPWVLVADDLVAAVGGEGEPAPPADRILQVPGCHLLPGFVDVHLHLSQAAWFGPGHPFAPGTRIAQTWIAGQQVWPQQAGEHKP